MELQFAAKKTILLNRGLANSKFLPAKNSLSFAYLFAKIRMKSMMDISNYI